MGDKVSKTRPLDVNVLLSPTPLSDTPPKTKQDSSSLSIGIAIPFPTTSSTLSRSIPPKVNTHTPTPVENTSDEDLADTEEESEPIANFRKRISSENSTTVPSDIDTTRKNWVVVPPKIGGRKPKQADVGCNTSYMLKYANALQHKPRRPRGHRAIETGFDRSPARYRVYDPSKLIMDYKTEFEYPTNSGIWRADMGTVIINRYAHKVDFSNRHHITKLNQWRSQILSRNFSKTQKARAYWLKSEKKQVLKLIEARFEESTQILWVKLTNTFNKVNKGTVQPAGSEFLSGGGVRAARNLTKDRKAPWRTSASIKHAAMKWPEWSELSNLRRQKTMDSADQLDDGLEEEYGSSSEDEDEVPDPNPAPPSYEETRRLQKEKSKEDRLRRKLKTPQKTKKSNSHSHNLAVEGTRSLVPGPEQLESSSVQAGSSEDSHDSSGTDTPRTSLGPSPQTQSSTPPTNSNGKRSADDSDDEDVPQMKRMKTLNYRSSSAPPSVGEFSSQPVDKVPKINKIAKLPKEAHRTLKEKTVKTKTFEKTTTEIVSGVSHLATIRP
jgi:hypothetical protein